MEIRANHSGNSLIGDSGTDYIVPSDDDNLESSPTSGLWVNEPGDLVVMWESGRISPVIKVGRGAVPFRVRRVMVGTTATGIVAMY